MTELDARFQVRFAWLPIRQVARVNADLGGFDFTGAFYWMRRVYAVNNANYGWIAFQDQQTQENFKRCPHCHGSGKQ